MLNYGLTNSLKRKYNNEAEKRCIQDILGSDESDEDDDASYLTEELRRERSHIFPSGRFYKDYEDNFYTNAVPPPGNAIDYYNRKQFHSILLQGTCDDKMMFIDVEIGHPGRVHDARMFMESALGKSLSTIPSSLLSEHEHILGDCAYPNSNYVVTPYKNNGRLTQPRILFNIRVCSGRSIIENAFGQLKGKFRRLKYLDMGEMEFVEEVIAASCVLHNFILFHKDNSPPLPPQYLEDDEEPSTVNNTEDSAIEVIHSAKRDKLLQTLEGKQPFRKRRRLNSF